MKKLMFILLFFPVLGFAQNGLIPLRQIAPIDTTNIVTAEWEAYIDRLTTSSPWNTDANGINYQSGNIGIGTTSLSSRKVFIDAGDDDGLQVWGGGTTFLGYAFSVADGAGNFNLFDIRGDGEIYAYRIDNATTTNTLYYNTSTKEVTYGTAPSGGTTYTAGEGIDIVSDIISGENATTTNKGIASFSSANFSTSSGAVSIKDLGVSIAEINATGTAKSSTYLRGDGTWATVATGGTDDQTLSFSGGSLSIEDGNSVNLDARYYTETELGSTTSGSSGANKIGTFDEFSNSASTNVQDVLDDLDAAISSGGDPNNTQTTIDLSSSPVSFDASVGTNDYESNYLTSSVVLTANNMSQATKGRLIVFNGTSLGGTNTITFYGNTDGAGNDFTAKTPEGSGQITIVNSSSTGGFVMIEWGFINGTMYAYDTQLK